MKLPILLLSFFVCIFSLAQKVSLDSQTKHYNLFELPNFPIKNPVDRTYVLNIKTLNSTISKSIYNELKVNQFKNVDNNGSVLISIIVNPATIKSIDYNTSKIESKDKDGKVISVQEKFYYAINYNQICKVEINVKGYNELIMKDFNYFKPYEDTNLFDTKELAIKYYESIKSQKLASLDTYCFEQTKFKIFEFIKSNISYEYTDKFVTFYFLDKEDHPKYFEFENAKFILQRILGKLKSNESTNWFKDDIDAFNEIFKKIISDNPSTDDKNNKKLLYSCYNNISSLAYMTENLDTAIEYADLVIKNDYDISRSKQIIDESKKLKIKLIANNLITSRLFE